MVVANDFLIGSVTEAFLDGEVGKAFWFRAVTEDRGVLRQARHGGDGVWGGPGGVPNPGELGGVLVRDGPGGPFIAGQTRR